MIRPLAKLRMPPDTFERHSIISRLAGRAGSVLDVGGVRGELGLFLPGAEVTTINMEGQDADAHFDGDLLPFEDDSFDLAVSLDVLEHIPAEQRARHFEELVRVARHQVLLCCPLGSTEHLEAEAGLAAWYREVTGEPHRFLEEHLQRGLPTAAELERLARGAADDHRIGYHGDFRRANEAFRRSTELKLHRTPGAAVAYARIRLDPRRSLDLERVASPHSNRAFIDVRLDSRQPDAARGPAGR
ncbi:MAG: class I SAM-dependent methyltransferase [Acidobacteriota bacterium]